MALVVTAMTSASLGSFCGTGRKEGLEDSKEGAWGGGVSRGTEGSTDQDDGVEHWRHHPCVMVLDARGPLEKRYQAQFSSSGHQGWGKQL